MRRRFISQEELNRVVKLKQAGASWLRIQNDTGIPRRLAKRAYEEWERNKSDEEIKRARTEVAVEEFRYHLEDLITLAQSLVSSLYIPMPTGQIDNADQFLDTLFKKDIRKERRAFLGTDEERRIMRENRMLFRSLQDHTREKVRWEALEEWKQALSGYTIHCSALRAEVQQVVENILNQAREFKVRLLAAARGTKPVEDMTKGVVESVWRAVRAGEPKVGDFIATKSFAKGTVDVFFGKDASITSIRFADSDLAERVADVCKQAARNVSMGKKSPPLLRKIREDMDIMESRKRELEEMLDDLVLRPVILRTRCELCPV